MKWEILCFILVPFMAVDINYSHHLQQGYDDEADCSSEGVEELQPILAGTGAEEQPHQEADETNSSWEHARTTFRRNITLKNTSLTNRKCNRPARHAGPPRCLPNGGEAIASEPHP